MLGPKGALWASWPQNDAQGICMPRVKRESPWVLKRDPNSRTTSPPTPYSQTRGGESGGHESTTTLTIPKEDVFDPGAVLSYETLVDGNALPLRVLNSIRSRLLSCRRKRGTMLNWVSKRNAVCCRSGHDLRHHLAMSLENESPWRRQIKSR